MLLCKLLRVTLIVSVLIISSCKKSSNPDEPDDPDLQSNVMDMYAAGANAMSALLQYGTDHNTDPLTTLKSIVDTVKLQENVADAAIQDSIHMVITLKNGLQTILSLEFQNEDGSSMIRGAGDGHYKLDGLTTEEGQRILVKNKRILFYSPPFDEFYTGMNADQDKVLEEIATNSGKDISFERVTGDNSSPSVIKTFKDYGLVIMSTHGFPFGFVAGSLNVPAFFRKQLQPNGTYKLEVDKVRNDADLKKVITENNEEGIYESLLNKEMITQFNIQVKLPYAGWVARVNRYIGNSRSLPAYLIVTAKYIENLSSFDSTIIFGNMCYSGATNNGQPLKAKGWDVIREGYLAIRDEMMKKNPGAYYCWVPDNKPDGLRVDNGGAIQAEQSLLKSLLVDLDTTGNAYKTNAGGAIRVHEIGQGGNESELKLFGKDNIWYGCGSGEITDDRDGNVYKTFCINGKEWMAENLRYNAQGSLVYNDDPENAKTYGRLYSWNIIMAGQNSSNAIPSGVRGICPGGWHVPSEGEFDQAIAALGGLSTAGAKMKSTTGWYNGGNGTNSSGFNLLPAGGYNVENGYGALGRNAYLRSSTFLLGGAWTYQADYNSTEILKKDYIINSEDGNPWYWSCRCAKD